MLVPWELVDNLEFPIFPESVPFYPLSSERRLCAIRSFRTHYYEANIGARESLLSSARTGHSNVTAKIVTKTRYLGTKDEG